MKNEKISQGLLETRMRRQTQTIKVFELKVNIHSTSKEDLQDFKICFFKQNGLQTIV